MLTDMSPSKRIDDPPLVIDATHYERLQSLAFGAMKAAGEAASRLLDELDRAEVRAPGSVPPNVVNIGSEVTFEDCTSGRRQSVRLVFPGEADISARRISVLTPIGVALIGLREGQQIGWETRDGETRRLRVLSVAPPPPEESS